MDAKLKIKWIAHACFEISGTKKIIIDPFIEGNPAATIKKEEVKADIVVVTHGHGDHVGDAIFIAKNNSAPIVTMVELAWLLKEKDNTLEVHDINFSGSVTIGPVTITAVPALHSSSFEGKFAGNPGGMIIKMDGKTIYHAGDTGVFLDMELIGEMHHPEIAMVPIGGHYTMSPAEASRAIEMIRPKIAIPMHYNTFPLIQQDPLKFKDMVERKGMTKVQVMIPGQTVEL